jgi:CelD/BcsL family acetyltransferase involved in cellulose biosynthesis
VEIELRSTLAPGEWGRLIREDSGATFFQTQEWSGLLARALPHMRPAHLTGRVGGELVCGLPLVRIGKAGFSILASMPYGTFGGPVLGCGAPPDAARDLVREFARLAAPPLVAAAHLADFAGRIAEPPSGFQAVGEEAQVVRLARPADEIQAGFKPAARNKIRKAVSAGVAVRRARTESDFLEYGRILADCSRRWGGRCDFGPAFFRGLALLDPDLVQMWLAEHEGRIIGGDLNFVLHGMVVNWGNVSLESAKQLAPNNLLHATAMEEGARAGLTLMNLGASAGIQGVDDFKASFGAVRVPYRRFTLEKPWYRAAKGLRRRGRKEGA